MFPVLLLIVLLASGPSASAADLCNAAFNHAEVVAAVADMESSIDPCGQSGELSSLIAKFRTCARNAYSVCINRAADRNSTDYSQDVGGNHVFITWNPDLRTELQVGCGGDPHRVVSRDPRASLLHEIAHIVQDCEGLDPNEHELDAVRIENIYRRARNLCQRTAYGDRRLPETMVVGCEPGHCLCTSGASPQIATGENPRAGHSPTTAGDAISQLRQ